MKNCWILVALFVLTTNGRAFQSADSSQKAASSNKLPATQVEIITPEELKQKIAKNEAITVVDLRGPSIFGESDRTLKGSLHTKVRKVVYRLREIPRDREIVTYCACPADEAAITGAQSLLAGGFKKVRVLKGGWTAWLAAGGQVQPKPKG